MKRLFDRIHNKLALVCLVCILFVLPACPAPGGEGFAIYLTRDDVPPSRMPVLSHVDIAAQPVIALADIVSYERRTHEITLTAEAYDRLSKLEVPVWGRSFVVCVDRQPIYWGAFWTMVSSMSFDGITILKPLAPRDPKAVRLDLGYPSAAFRTAPEDPRPNAEVMRSLEQAGKLTTASPAP